MCDILKCETIVCSVLIVCDESIQLYTMVCSYIRRYKFSYTRMDVKPLGHYGCVSDVYTTQQHHPIIQNKGHNMKRSVVYHSLG